MNTLQALSKTVDSVVDYVSAMYASKKELANIDQKIQNNKEEIEEAAENINEVSKKTEEALSIAKGARQGIVFDSYEDLLTRLPEIPNDELSVGTNIYFYETDVSDLWVAEIADRHRGVNYETVEALQQDLDNYGFAGYLGYYTVAKLETQKVNLEEINSAIASARSLANEAYWHADSANMSANEAISIAKGANKALVFNDYEEMINALSIVDQHQYKVGQNILIVKIDVPDLWISEVTTEFTEYPFEGDDYFISDLNNYGPRPVGYYRISALETQKVNLEEINSSINNAYSTANEAYWSANIAQETANEAINIAKGASRAIMLTGYDYVVDYLKSAAQSELRVGDNIYLYDIDVPDLWVSEVRDNYVDYSWNSQQEMIDIMTEQGYLSIGYYNISMLETQKANLGDLEAALDAILEIQNSLMGGS